MDEPQIPMQPLRSSSVSAYGYDATRQVLAVQFNNGRTYHYEGIQPEQAAGLATAKSAGRYVNELLRGKPATPLQRPTEVEQNPSTVRVRAPRPIRTRGGR